MGIQTALVFNGFEYLGVCLLGSLDLLVGEFGDCAGCSCLSQPHSAVSELDKIANS